MLASVSRSICIPHSWSEMRRDIWPACIFSPVCRGMPAKSESFAQGGRRANPVEGRSSESREAIAPNGVIASTARDGDCRRKVCRVTCH
jgi:hypothetical protein